MRWFLGMGLLVLLVGCDQESDAPVAPVRLTAWSGEADLQPLRLALQQADAIPPAGLRDQAVSGPVPFSQFEPTMPAAGEPAVVEPPSEPTATPTDGDGEIAKSQPSDPAKDQAEPGADDGDGDGENSGRAQRRRREEGDQPASEPAATEERPREQPTTNAASGPRGLRPRLRPPANMTARDFSSPRGGNAGGASPSGGPRAISPPMTPAGAGERRTEGGAPRPEVPKIVVRARLLGASKVPDPGTVPYDDCITTLRIRIVEVLEGDYDKPEMLVVADGLKDGKLTDAARPPVGLPLTFQMTLVPFSSKADKQRLMVCDDYADDPSPRWWIEKFRM